MTLTLGEGLKARMVAHAGLNALISGRCYPVQVPQSPTFPCVTYQAISVAPAQALGASATVYQSWRYQVSAWASSYSSARAVAAQVVACLDGFSGLLGTTGPQTVITWMGGVDMLEPDGERWHAVNDFEVWTNG